MKFFKSNKRKQIDHLNDKCLISVVIGSFNRRNIIDICIDEIRNELEDIPHEIIVVDGGSVDGSLQWLIAQKDIITICQHNSGIWNGKPIAKRSWGYFMNLGFKCAQGKYICMLSDDTLIHKGAIKNGLELAETKNAEGELIGGVAFYFRDYPIRKKYAVAVNIGNLYVNHGLFLNKALQEVNYISEDDYFFYFADTDLSIKISQAGYKIIRSPQSFVEHYYDADPDIRKSNNDIRKDLDRKKLIEKWAGIAFPSVKKTYYSQTVGYWDFMNIDNIDGDDTINRLLKAFEMPDS
jgi:GT2 family glycosyltransferase